MDRILTMVAGISGTGKSYFVKNSLLPALKGKKPVIIFDRMAEYAGRNKTDVPENWPYYNGVKDFFNSIKENNYDLSNDIHVILCDADKDYQLGINFFKALEKPVTLVIDEAHDLFTASEFKDVGRALTGIARYGRKYGIDFILITQRTKDVPPDVRSQFNGNVISFKQAYAGDVEALKNIGCEDAEQVLDLNERNYKIFGKHKKQIKQLVK